MGNNTDMKHVKNRGEFQSIFPISFLAPVVFACLFCDESIIGKQMTPASFSS